MNEMNEPDLRERLASMGQAPGPAASAPARRQPPKPALGAALLGGAVIVENIFAWPGVGRYALFAISNRDYPVLQCFILFMTVVFVLCTLASDILCAWLDPRLRFGSGEQQ